MNICFRVDASIDIGSGHVMRCLTLAKELQANGCKIYFICRLHKGHLCELISNYGFEVFELSPLFNTQKGNNNSYSSWLGANQEDDAIETIEVLNSNNIKCDWMIIDHYGVSKVWESKVKKYVKSIMVIDDLAERPHDSDILLDQNFYQNKQERYQSLVPENCKLLLGPKYSLLREEFLQCYNDPEQSNSILVFYGGSDPTNETIKALNAIKQSHINDYQINVVVGPSNPNKNYIETFCNENNYHFHFNISYIAKLMYQATVALCAGGSTTWERYCVGLPAIVTAIADNQIELCENSQLLHIDTYLGTFNSVSEQIIKCELESFLERNDINELSENAKRIVDGKGKIRVVNSLLNS